VLSPNLGEVEEACSVRRQVDLLKPKLVGNIVGLGEASNDVSHVISRFPYVASALDGQCFSFKSPPSNGCRRQRKIQVTSLLLKCKTKTHISGYMCSTLGKVEKSVTKPLLKGFDRIKLS
jgi:hypothetical protein